MTVEKKDLLQTSTLTNECPDVRPRLVAAGKAPEKKYPWMVLGQISPKYDGDCNVLLVAPHGFPGDDDNVEVLTCLLAEKDGLNCFAVVNNRKYNRYADPAKYEFWHDLNNKDQAPNRSDFWGPLVECKNLIIQNYVKPPLILFIHGIGNLNADDYLEGGDFALGAGYEGTYDPKIATASEELVTKLRDSLTKKFGLAKDGVKDYGATQSVPILFREMFPNERIEALQLEIRCRGYRDSMENIEKLVNGLKEILTDTTEQGFQDYFTRERKVLDGITIDEQFKSFVPPLSEEERQQLEENILAVGACHDPLRVWPYEGKLILLDGHHRREICHKHGLPNPAIVEVELGSRVEAIKWIRNHQLGRRNLNRFQRCELVYHSLEPEIRELATERQKGGHKLRRKGADTADVAAFHTDETAGKEAGVGARTYRKVRDILIHGSQDLIQNCRDGEISIDAAFKQIEKPRNERTVKKAAAPPQTAAQGAQGIAPEPVPESPVEPVQLTAGQPVPQSDEAVSMQDLPPPCDVIIVNVPWELPSVTVEKLALLPIPNVTQDNCMLWLRATNSRMQEAYALLSHWGFESKTLFTWIKQETEPAEWLNDRSEHYVLGVKGNPIVDEERKFSTASETGAAKDNPKRPMQFYRLIELYCPGETRLDVFSETAPDGWIPWNPWTVDKQVEGMMREKATPEDQEKSSKKESAKSTKKGSKSKSISKKKRPNAKE